MAVARERTIPIVQGGGSLGLSIGGHPYRLRIWTYDEWLRLAESRRPAEAREYLGVGWFSLQPDRPD